MITQLNDIDELNRELQKQPFDKNGWALYRFPDSETVQFITGPIEKVGVGANSKNGFIISPFNDQDEQGWQIQNLITAQFNVKDPFEKLERLVFYHNSVDTVSTPKEDYCKLVEDILIEIAGQKLVKAVPARTKYIESTKPFDPFPFYKSLLETYPNAFVYIISTPDTGTWIGCTPELLLKAKGDSIMTLSLAGTRKANNTADPATKDLFSIKEIREQAIVTSYIKGILKKYCYDIAITGPDLIDAGNVYHLGTYFNATLNPDLHGNYLSLVRDLHPTPAVCGLPLNDSLEFLLQHENFDRSLYSGFLGPISESGADLFVNLRCMQVHKDGFKLYAGAGVVEGSDPEKEWIETEEKMNTLLRFI